MKGDLTCAEGAFGRAVAIDPANEAAKRGREAVKAKSQPAPEKK